jgi:AcrR family transcriptional regulator
MMVSQRRVGNETSKTRGLLLDGAERLMLEEGYAALSYRRVAAEAGVTAGLVQYYFPTLDDLLVGMLRRHADNNLERLLAELEARKDEPLRVVWEYSSNETTAAMTVEFMALANHHKALRAEIVNVGERSRRVQIEALSQVWQRYDFSDEHLSPTAVQFILAGIPKLVLLEEALEGSEGHNEIVSLLERLLERVEPRRGGTEGVEAFEDEGGSSADRNKNQDAGTSVGFCTLPASNSRETSTSV